MRRRRERSLATMSEINVTSLVDVAFTLLVIFIITAPILQSGVEVAVPRAQAAPITATDGIIVSIDAQRRIFIGEAPTTWEEFEIAFPEIARRERARNAYLRADAGVDYGLVLQVLAAMKSVEELTTVGLVAEPEPRRRR
jgi:biopolymer transport protein TolR